jgi:hypothetical protein
MHFEADGSIHLLGFFEKRKFVLRTDCLCPVRNVPRARSHSDERGGNPCCRIVAEKKARSRCATGIRAHCSDRKIEPTGERSPSFWSASSKVMPATNSMRSYLPYLKALRTSYSIGYRAIRISPAAGIGVARPIKSASQNEHMSKSAIQKAEEIASHFAPFPFTEKLSAFWGLNVRARPLRRGPKKKTPHQTNWLLCQTS